MKAVPVQYPSFALRLFKAIAAEPHEQPDAEATAPIGALPCPSRLVPALSGEPVSGGSALTAAAPTTRCLDILLLPNRDADVRVVRDLEHLEHADKGFEDPADEEWSQEVAQRSRD